MVSHLCMQIYASPPTFIIIQRRNYKEKQFFFLSFQRESNSRPLNLQTNALSTGPRQQSLEHLRQKLIFNCQACSQGPRIFSRWRPLFRASSKCLRPVSVMLATATPQSPAMKRPLENLEL